MNRILKKLVPGALAAALALGAVPSGITFDDILASADGGSVKIEGLSLTVDSSYGLNCYVSLSDGLSASDVSVVYHTPNAGTDETVVTTEKLPSSTTLNNKTVYKITVPVYPKHYDKTATLQFKNGDTVYDLKYSDDTDVTDGVLSTTVKAYLENIEGNYNKIITDETKAKQLYDLAHALKLYGQYAQYYFAHKSDTSGDYTVPSWWTANFTTSDYTTEWKTNLGLLSSDEGGVNTLDKALGSNNAPSTPTIIYGGDSTHKTVTVYKVALVLDQDIKVRYFFKNFIDETTPEVSISCLNGTTILNDSAEYKHDTGEIDIKYMDTVGLPIGKLQQKNEMTVKWTFGNYNTIIDTFDATPVGYARQIINPLGQRVESYEVKGLANTMRAMYVADLAAKAYFNIV